MRKVSFIDAKDIDFQFELSQIENNYSEVYKHFMQYDDEVCYVHNHGELYGIITIGDLYRFYYNKNKSAVNQNFKFIEEIDFKAAEEIFNRIKTVHEVAVIRNHKLLGCIRMVGDIQNTAERQRARDSIVAGYAHKLERNTKKELLAKLSGKVYLYTFFDANLLSEFEKSLSMEEKELYYKKQKYENGNISQMSESELRDYFGEMYSPEYVEEFCNDYNKIRGSINKGIYKNDDMSSKNFNYFNGYRKVPNIPRDAAKRVYMFGFCTIAGSYVEDSKTIEFYLQKFLLDAGVREYEVVNCGLFGPGHVWGRVATEKISEDDIVIILDNENFSHEEIKNVNYRENLFEVYFEIENPVKNIFNSLAHCNHIVNEKIAERIFHDIKPSITVNESKQITPRTAIQDYYISGDVILYFKKYFEKYELKKQSDKSIGAIVMNCNPFTKGHRYLIEKASAMVDLLYIFVVEEDSSVYKFKDRIEMVRRGIADMENVKVFPSGQYILSKDTFEQYFEKDAVEYIEDMDYDVRIFGEVVAKELGITARFVGEEPFDKVTARYNEMMKCILPEYGVKVIEIPRAVTQQGKIISASAVREAIEKRDTVLLDDMLPRSTIEYISRS